MALTAAKQALLRQPFTAAAVKFRPAVKKPDKGARVRCLTYIDSRLAAERLTEVDPGWEFQYIWDAAVHGDPLGASHFFPVRGILRVDGVTREDVGQLGSSMLDDKHAKSAVSDALKRCAVLYGVGAYLYALGDCFVTSGGYWLKGDGTVGGLNAEGARQLREWYTKRISEKSFVERFGKPIDYGDIAPDVDDEPVAEAPVKAAPVKKKPVAKDDAVVAPDNTSDAAVAAIGDLVELTGGNRKASEKWAAAYSPEDAIGITLTKLKTNGKLLKVDAVSVLSKHGLEKFIDTFDAVEVPDVKS